MLWLRGNRVEAAFEVEHTTAVYSGLLRMSDLITLHPNLMIRLYIVAPDALESRTAVHVAGADFADAHRGLSAYAESCRFPYDETCRFRSG